MQTGNQKKMIQKSSFTYFQKVVLILSENKSRFTYQPVFYRIEFGIARLHQRVQKWLIPWMRILTPERIL